jgi:REP element-mobilizing transposase RayT
VTNRGNRREALFRTDRDRHRFLGLVAELPERFRFEIHAFVLMDNHYHLLVRTVEPTLSHGIRWLNVTYGSRFNWAHRQVGHVFQGRFKSVMIEDPKGVCEVARYVHLNPVRVGGLGLGKEDQRRARIYGTGDPGAALVAKRLQTLHNYPWSSWRVYSGAERCPDWLETGVVAGDCGGRTGAAQRAALRAYTEAPVRQGRLDSPWEQLVGGWFLGDAEQARKLCRSTKVDADEQTEVRRVRRTGRMELRELIRAAEQLLGRKWPEMLNSHGDWGRDAVVHVATRYGGYRLAEILRVLPGVKYQAAAQGVRRFLTGLKQDTAKARLVDKLRKQLSTI